MRLALAFLLLALLPVHAADSRQEFRDALVTLSATFDQIQPAQIYSVARAVFSVKTSENKASVDNWISKLPAFSGTDGYTGMTSMQHPVSQEDADKAVSEPGSSDRLFLQAFAPEDIVWVALDQVAGMNLRPEAQSQKIVRAYVKPRIELAGRDGAKTIIAIFDFDYLIVATTIQTDKGVLLPIGYQILKKKVEQDGGGQPATRPDSK